MSIQNLPIQYKKKLKTITSVKRKHFVIIYSWCAIQLSVYITELNDSLLMQLHHSLCETHKVQKHIQTPSHILILSLVSTPQCHPQGLWSGETHYCRERPIACTSDSTPTFKCDHNSLKLCSVYVAYVYKLCEP